VPITFDEVAVYFLEEEWRHLEAWQRQLYQEVMRDNLEAVISLGYEYRHPPPSPRVFTEDDKWTFRHSEDPLVGILYAFFLKKPRGETCRRTCIEDLANMSVPTGEEIHPSRLWEMFLWF
ncbi:unnamed protein product, partial [Staurois parvus]